MLKAIFFDLDDTLENWWIAKTAIREKFCGFVAKKYNLEREEFWKLFVKVEYEIVGKSFDPMVYDRKKWIGGTLKRFGINAKENDLNKMEKLYWKIAYSKIKAFPDTIPTLKKLKDYRKIIITDSDGDPKNEIKNKKIRIIGIRKYFDMVITSNDTGKNKPDKKSWQIALKKYGLKPEECMMIGDKPEMDLKPTKEMGFTTVWIRQGHWASMRKDKKFKYADYTVDKISEILKIIK